MKAVPPSRYLIFFIIVIGGCWADLATKSWIFARLGMLNRKIEWLWPGILGLQTSLNEGALFGLGQGKVELFVLLSIAAIIGIMAWLFIVGSARDWLLTIASGCIIAGILGNLYDRLGWHGLKWPANCPPHQAGDAVHAVRDWILVMIGRWPWPNFNIADSLLVCGAALLFWPLVFTSESKPTNLPAPEQRADKVQETSASRTEL